MILVTGATGSVGRTVLNEVRNAGQPFKGFYRSADEARKAPEGVATVTGDFSSKDSLKSALKGVDVVFLVCSPIPQLVELETNVIEASRESGVKHVVLNSALGAGDYAKSFPSWHRKVEDNLKASGLNYTILRPNGFMQNILGYNAPTIRTLNAFYAAMGSAPTSILDVRDIAVATAKILTNPAAHEGKTYELNGPEAVSNPELARRISKVANREIKYVDLPEAVFRKSLLEVGMPLWQADALLELQQYYATGKCGAVTEVLPQLLGQPPIRLNEFLQEFREEFRSQAASA